MTEAKKKAAPKKTAAKKDAPKKADAAKKDQKELRERLPEFWKASAKGWKDVQEARLDFAKENADKYFDSMKASYEAKSFAEASDIRNEFTMNVILRQIEQAREINKVAEKARKEAWDALGIKLPNLLDRAA